MKTRRRRKRAIGISKRNISAEKVAKSWAAAAAAAGTYQTVFQIYHTQIHGAHKNIKISSIEFYIFSSLSRFYGFFAQDLLPCHRDWSSEDCSSSTSNLNLTSLILVFSCRLLSSQFTSSERSREEGNYHTWVIHKLHLSFIWRSSSPDSHNNGNFYSKKMNIKIESTR